VKVHYQWVNDSSHQRPARSQGRHFACPEPSGLPGPTDFDSPEAMIAYSEEGNVYPRVDDSQPCVGEEGIDSHPTVAVRNLVETIRNLRPTVAFT